MTVTRIDYGISIILKGEIDNEILCPGGSGEKINRAQFFVSDKVGSYS